MSGRLLFFVLLLTLCGNFSLFFMDESLVSGYGTESWFPTKKKQSIGCFWCFQAVGFLHCLISYHTCSLVQQPINNPSSEFLCHFNVPHFISLLLFIPRVLVPRRSNLSHPLLGERLSKYFRIGLAKRGGGGGSHVTGLHTLSHS